MNVYRTYQLPPTAMPLQVRPRTTSTVPKRRATTLLRPRRESKGPTRGIETRMGVRTLLTTAAVPTFSQHLISVDEQVGSVRATSGVAAAKVARAEVARTTGFENIMLNVGDT